MTSLKITLVKSAIGYARDQRGTLRALGLKRLRQTVVHDDSPSVRGMVEKVKHLVVVEEAG
ncbi:MAG: 50S ribosomal protein L30 [Dehalococcoidia bacterium]